MKHAIHVREGMTTKYVTWQQVSMYDSAERNMVQWNAEDREVLQQAKALAEAGVEVTDGEFLARVVRRGI